MELGLDLGLSAGSEAGSILGAEVDEKDVDGNRRRLPLNWGRRFCADSSVAVSGLGVSILTASRGVSILMASSGDSIFCETDSKRASSGRLGMSSSSGVVFSFRARPGPKTLSRLGLVPGFRCS